MKAKRKQKNKIYEDLLIKSGAKHPNRNGETHTAMVQMPKPKPRGLKAWDWTVHYPDKIEEKQETIVDWGYAEMESGVDWRYIV